MHQHNKQTLFLFLDLSLMQSPGAQQLDASNSVKTFNWEDDDDMEAEKQAANVAKLERRRVDRQLLRRLLFRTMGEHLFHRSTLQVLTIVT
jgi:hypothetical protein